MAKVSVIVPVYGVESYIKKCIGSIVSQTFDDIEIVVVDDGCKDSSIKIIKENFNDNRICIYSKKNGGLASARNFGLKKATSDYVLFVDSDDFIDKNMIYDMYNTIVNDKVDYVICDYFKYYDDINKEHVSIIPHYDKENEKCAVISMPTATCKLFKRSLFIDNDLSFLEGKYFEDNAIMPFVCAIGGKFSYIKKPYYYYLQRDGSILNKAMYDKRWEDIFDSLNNLYKKFDEYGIINEYYSELEYIYIEYLLHASNLRFLKYKEAYSQIKKVANVMKRCFPNWRKNKYFRNENIKYRIVCTLFYYRMFFVLKLILK